VAPESPAIRQTTTEPSYPRYRVEPGQRIDLGTIDPDDTAGYTHKDHAESAMTALHQRIEALQARLYAENKQSLLIVLQALDAGGKDGTIRNVFHGVNPQGCRVWSFKQPSSEELAHDFLWRYHRKTPPRGMITYFTRKLPCKDNWPGSKFTVRWAAPAWVWRGVRQCSVVEPAAPTVAETWTTRCAG